MRRRQGGGGELNVTQGTGWMYRGRAQSQHKLYGATNADIQNEQQLLHQHCWFTGTDVQMDVAFSTLLRHELLGCGKDLELNTKGIRLYYFQRAEQERRSLLRLCRSFTLSGTLGIAPYSFYLHSWMLFDLLKSKSPCVDSIFTRSSLCYRTLCSMGGI